MQLKHKWLSDDEDANADIAASEDSEEKRKARLSKQGQGMKKTHSCQNVQKPDFDNVIQKKRANVRNSIHAKHSKQASTMFNATSRSPQEKSMR